MMYRKNSIKFSPWNVSCYDKEPWELEKNPNVFQNLYPVKSFDDTTVFLKIAHQIPVTMQDIEFFSKASGLYIDV